MLLMLKVATFTTFLSVFVPSGCPKEQTSSLFELALSPGKCSHKKLDSPGQERDVVPCDRRLVARRLFSRLGWASRIFSNAEIG